MIHAMSIVCLVILSVAILIAPPPVGAGHEPLALYEDWNGDTVSSTRWATLIDAAQEFHRLISGHKLSLRLRREGSTASDAGAETTRNRMSFVAPALVDAVEADVRVEVLEVTHCAANPLSTENRPAAIRLNKFSDGTPGPPGNFVGDHFGRIQLVRRSDSADPPDTMRAEADVFRCTDAGCVGVAFVTQFVFPELVSVRERVRLRLVWDEANSEFLARVNDGPDVALAYTPELNAGPARVPLADIRIQAVTANCTAGGVVSDTRIKVGDVSTNVSALFP